MKEKMQRSMGVFWLLMALVALLTVIVGFFIRFVPIESESLEQLEIIFRLLFGILVVLATSNILTKIINAKLNKLAEFSKAKFDKTRFSIAQNLVSVIIYSIAVIIIMRLVPGLEDLAFSALAGAGIAAIIIGFAAKDVASNLIAGIFIAIFQPFRVGDRIRFDDSYGKVEDITLRHTIIKTWENLRLVVPNMKMSEATIVNYSLKGDNCIETVEMPISYDSNIDKAKKIMKEETMKHKEFSDSKIKSALLSSEEPVKVRVISIAESAIVLRLYFWAKDKPTGFRMACDLREAIKKKFDKEGIEIPFPYRTLVYKEKRKRK